MLGRMRQHQELCDSLELRAVIAHGDGRDQEAAYLLQVAASVAADNHPGWFVWPSLERLAGEIGAGLHEHAPRAVDASGPVCHVLTGDAVPEIASVRSWWSADPTARVLALPDGSRGVLDAAAELRAQVADASLVVMHGTTPDIVPVVAFGSWRSRPPVVVIESADRAFWPGVSFTDLLVVGDATALALAVHRRCVPEGRTVLVEPYERTNPDALTAVLTEARRRIEPGRMSTLPAALLRGAVSSLDGWVVRRQRELGVNRGMVGALGSWPAPDELARRPGWVVWSTDVDDTLDLLADLLQVSGNQRPDIVVVTDSERDGDELRELLVGVAQVVVVDGTVDRVEVAVALSEMYLINASTLVISDGVTLTGPIVAVLEDLAGGVAGTQVLDVPDGEIGLVVERAPMTPAGTGVREGAEITEKRGELFHTELTVMHGPRSVDHNSSAP